MSKFCDSHKRWFAEGTECDYCENDGLNARYKPMPTAAYYAKLLADHAEHGHLVTERFTLPDGNTLTLEELQYVCWSLEHELG